MPSNAPAPMPILNMPEKSDMATSVASDAMFSTLTCMLKAMAMIVMPQIRQRTAMLALLNERQQQQQTKQHNRDGGDHDAGRIAAGETGK